MQAPKIDQRSFEKLSQAFSKGLNHHLPGYEEAILQDGNLAALQVIHGRFMSILQHRLNLTLDKNFLSFLEMLGINPAPQQAAKAPLVFTLAEGTQNSLLVPQGMQIEAEESPDEEDIIFETLTPLSLVPFHLIQAFSHAPNQLSFQNHKALLEGVLVRHGRIARRSRPGPPPARRRRPDVMKPVWMTFFLLPVSIFAARARTAASADFASLFGYDTLISIVYCIFFRTGPRRNSVFRAIDRASMVKQGFR